MSKEKDKIRGAMSSFISGSVNGTSNEAPGRSGVNMAPDEKRRIREERISIPRRGRPRGDAAGSGLSVKWFTTTVSVDEKQWRKVDEMAYEMRLPSMKAALHALLSCGISEYEKNPEAFVKKWK